MTKEQIEVEKKHIDSLTHIQLARIYRFAPSGHKYFDAFGENREIYDYFMTRFKSLGGITTEVSKYIGWDR